MLVAPPPQSPVICVMEEEPSDAETTLLAVAGDLGGEGTGGVPSPPPSDDQSPSPMVEPLMESKENLEEQGPPPTVVGDLEGKGALEVSLPLPSGDHKPCPMVAATPKDKESCGFALAEPSDDNKHSRMVISDQALMETNGLLEPLASENQQSSVVRELPECRPVRKLCRKDRKMSSPCPLGNKKRSLSHVVRDEEADGSHGSPIFFRSDKGLSPSFLHDRNGGSRFLPMDFLDYKNSFADDHEWGDREWSFLGLQRFQNWLSPMDIDVPHEQRRQMYAEMHFRGLVHRKDKRNGRHSFNCGTMRFRDHSKASSCCLLDTRYGKKTFLVGAAMSNPQGWICFVNCILQCIVHTVPLVRKLRSADHPDPCSRASNKFCCFCSLKFHVDEVINLSGNVLYPNKFVQFLKVISPDFGPGRHQDAHEFLRCLLDKLDYASVIPRSSSEEPLSSEEGSIVKQVFGGRLKSQLRCPECNHCSDRFEPFLDLSLEVVEMNSIVDALESFTKVEIIEDFSCEGCKSRVNVEKHLKVEQEPEVLVIQLKRFQKTDNDIRKIQKVVDYPLELDLNPFLCCPDDTPLNYDLYGVVKHIGLPSRGHYVCFIRSSPADWYYFNDEKVFEASEAEVLNSNAYLLFYVKQGSYPWFSTLLERRISSPLFDTGISSDEEFIDIDDIKEESTSSDGEDCLLRLLEKSKTSSSSQSSAGKSETSTGLLGLLEENESTNRSPGSSGKNENGSDLWGSSDKPQGASNLQGSQQRNGNISTSLGSLQKNGSTNKSLGSPDTHENSRRLKVFSDKNENGSNQQGSTENDENNSTFGSPCKNRGESNLHGDTQIAPEENGNHNSKFETSNEIVGPEEMIASAASLHVSSPMDIEACCASQFDVANSSYPKSDVPEGEFRRSSNYHNPTGEANSSECSNNGINDEREGKLVSPAKRRLHRRVRSSAKRLALLPRALRYLHRVAKTKRKSKKCRWVVRTHAIL